MFLKQQHHDTLEQLHKEIEGLRSENRGKLNWEARGSLNIEVSNSFGQPHIYVFFSAAELHFKLVMCCCGGKGRIGERNVVWKVKVVEISDS